MNDLTKNLLLWVVVAVVLMVVFQSFSPKSSGAGAQGASYSQFLDQVDSGNVQKVAFGGDMRGGTSQLTYTTRGGQSSTITAPFDRDLINVLRTKNVEIVQEEPSSGISLGAILMNFLPVILIIGFWLFIMRQMQGGGGGAKGAMSFGKSRAKLQGEDQIKVTFADVAGCDEAKEEVGELVDFLRDPSKFTKLGGKIPRGVLMVGPPGTGKTLLAKAIAGEAKVPFFSISGSDFVEMFVGVGASRVRDMFEQAKKHAPCIIFIDEIDAVGRHRGAGLGGGHDEREQTLNQLLVEMDGFEGGEGVIIIAATNRPDVLDPALLRPGRFDRQVVVGLPDIKGREQILKVHMRKVPIADDVKPSLIARGTPGFSGADLMNLVNEAALFAATHMSRDGRVIAKRPGMGFGDVNSGEYKTTLWAEMVKHYGMELGLIVQGEIWPALETLRLEHRLRAEDFIAIASNSPIVPTDRKRLMGRALFAGYDNDFVVALHLLVPQIEHMVRWHLKGVGVKTTTLDKDGIENENGLSTLMDLPEVDEVFGKECP